MDRLAFGRGPPFSSRLGCLYRLWISFLPP
ncbi:hypothetical protein F383_19053 [Gossypium arboreum]|uniref:Uncharacterized protein n=1 Tax=Gossypium arboreum TaxID=29729 RepID=A0A0B0NJ10_GOSAR|nr:hypothetical protein F383_19053 [Gossypium arboreum]